MYKGFIYMSCCESHTTWYIVSAKLVFTITEKAYNTKSIFLSDLGKIIMLPLFS